MTIFKKQKHLPNISVPYTDVVKNLKDNNISFKLITINPNHLKPIHNVLMGHKVIESNNIDPIYISEDLSIIDGHYKVANALSNNRFIKAIKIYGNIDDIVRILNKIQDIHDYEKQKSLEEIVIQNYRESNENIDNNSEINNDDTDVNMDINNDFISSFEKDNISSDAETQNPEETKINEKIIGYRNTPINEKSNIGNFFLLKKHKGYDNKYEIEFENLLDLSNWDLNDERNSSPVELLSLIWFPHIDFNKLSMKYGVPTINIINRAVAENAKKMGYDGIKYNDNLLQAFK